MKKQIKKIIVAQRPIVSYVEKVWNYCIPTDYTVMVSDRQRVAGGTTLARGLVPSEVVNIDLRELCGKVNFSGLKRLVKKEEGEAVMKDEVILLGRFGNKKINIKSPIDGVFSVKNINRGVITIIGPVVEKYVKSVHGGVVRVNGGNIQIASKGYVSRYAAACFVSSDEPYIEGVWHFVEEVEAVTRKDVEGKIVWTNASVFTAEIERLGALGVKAVVSPSIVLEKWDDMLWLFKNTTNWLVWYGFGECKLSNEQTRDLRRWNGSIVVCDKMKKEIGFPKLGESKENGYRHKVRTLVDLKTVSIGNKLVVVGTDKIEVGKVVGVDQKGCINLEIGKHERKVCGKPIFIV